MSTALIAGSSPELEADLALAHEYGPFIVTIACNFAGERIERIDYVATLHADRIDEIRHRRRSAGHDTCQVISNSRGESAKNMPDIVAQLTRPVGSTAMYACNIALDRFGIDRCLLAGVGLSDPPYDQYQKRWQNSHHWLRGRVWSLSGWTRDFLGHPWEQDGEAWGPPWL